MKINKILAAGVAATLAVTSLSAVASAEVQTKTFDVYTNVGSFNDQTVSFEADLNKNIASKLRQATTSTISLKDLDTFVAANTLWSDYVASVKLTATGYQHIGDASQITKTFTFSHNATKNTSGKTEYPGVEGAWELKVLKDDVPIYHDGEFASYFFAEITNLKLDITMAGETELEAVWNQWTAGADDGSALWTQLQVQDIAITDDVYGNYTYGTYTKDNQYKDLDEVLAVQAVDNVTTFPKAADLATANTALLIGTPVQTTSIGQALGTTQSAFYNTGAKGYVCAAAATAVTTADTIAVAAINKTTIPAVLDNNGVDLLAKYKYVYTATESGGTNVHFICTNNPIDAAGLLTIQAAKVAATAMTAADFLAAVNAVDSTAKVYTGVVANALPVFDEIDKDYYDYVVGDTISGADGATPDQTAVAAPANAKIITIAADGTTRAETRQYFYTGVSASRLSDTISTAHLLAYAFANGGWYESKQEYVDNWAASKGFGAYNASTTKYNGWLPKTTYESNGTIKNKIERGDVWILSVTNEIQSTGRGYGRSTIKDDDQSYNATFWDGTYPQGFAGLASQVADFFNKQDNGTITFTFAADAGTTAGKWNDGIPSTEVGLKGYTSEYLNDFALFFNYSNTTGTMLSAIKLDKTAGSVTFDLADYLADCGGLTKATLENIYYGLDNGIRDTTDRTGKRYGLWVSKVELAYDDAGKAAVDATTDDDTSDDDAAVVVADDDDDDAEVEDDDVAEDDDIFEDDDVIEDDDDDDDDVDADVIEDDDDDDTDVNNDVDYVDAGADDDANPGTGVGLAVIPAIVAAAAVVVSKKRK